jgi:hypothetical protein
MVELIVTEKRMQYRGRTSINIEADLGGGLRPLLRRFAAGI